MNNNLNRGKTTARPASKPAQLVATDDTRAIFNAANERAKAKGQMAVPGFLRFEKLLKAGTNRYSFSPLKDSNSDTVTERKLDRNDEFTITELAVFLMKRTAATAGCEVLQTYPNATVFPTGPTLNAAHLEAVYNGNLSLQVGNTKFVEAMDLNRFRSVPTTLQSSGNANSERSERDGFAKLTPQITIKGDVKTTIDIEIPTFDSMLLGTDVFVVIMARGFQITAK